MSTESEAQSRSRREEYAEATWQAVVAAARELFAETGYSRTTVEQIARRARVSPGRGASLCSRVRQAVPGPRRAGLAASWPSPRPAGGGRGRSSRGPWLRTSRDAAASRAVRGPPGFRRWRGGLGRRCRRLPRGLCPSHRRHTHRTRQLHPVRSQPVQMAGWAALRRGLLPLGVKQAPVGKPDQDRVQRTGLKARLRAKLISVPPARGLAGQGVQDLDRLRRWSPVPGHTGRLYV